MVVEQMTAVDSQTMRGSWWSITINNPTDDDRTRVKNLPLYVKYVKGQDEIGETGTLHIQAVANTAQCRMSQMSKWLPRAHFKVIKTDDHRRHTLEYVWKKDGTEQPGTQFEYGKVGDEHPTFPHQLMMIANEVLNMEENEEFVVYTDLQIRENQGNVGAITIERRNRTEFECAIQNIVRNDFNMVAVFGRPELSRAWQLFRNVALEKARSDRQTNVTVTPVD